VRQERKAATAGQLGPTPASGPAALAQRRSTTDADHDADKHMAALAGIQAAETDAAQALRVRSIVAELRGGFKDATLAGARSPRRRGPIDSVPRHGSTRRDSVTLALPPHCIRRPNCLRGAGAPSVVTSAIEAPELPGSSCREERRELGVPAGSAQIHSKVSSGSPASLADDSDSPEGKIRAAVSTESALLSRQTERRRRHARADRFGRGGAATAWAAAALCLCLPERAVSRLHA